MEEGFGAGKDAVGGIEIDFLYGRGVREHSNDDISFLDGLMSRRCNLYWSKVFSVLVKSRYRVWNYVADQNCVFLTQSFPEVDGHGIAHDTKANECNCFVG